MSDTDWQGLSWQASSQPTCRFSPPAGSCSPAPGQLTPSTLCRRLRGRPDCEGPPRQQGALEVEWRCPAVQEEAYG